MHCTSQLYSLVRYSLPMNQFLYLLVLKYCLQVFIVAGGYSGSSSYLSSTEVLRAGGSRWRTGGALPSARYGLRGVTILNQFYVTGECWAVMMYLVSVVPLIIFR